MKTLPTLLSCRVAALLIVPFCGVSMGQQNSAPVPDLTKDGKRDEAHDWTLGPTGARGWIFTANGHSRDARQILVTEVAKRSPADGVLSAGDVILGVEGKAFSGDARVLFAKTITAAEAEKGALRLLVWRAGEAGTVELKLPVLGSYSATTPYACEKTKRIFELGSASLAKRMTDESTYTKRLDPIPRALNGLALLASGNKEWLPLIKREAQWAADFTTSGYLSWYYGFNMALAAEYVMATGDQSVMPGLTRLALETARGQSGVGTWGHRFAPAGGNLGGYGAMNAPGLPLTIGMVLAREAGVKHPDLDRAIAKASGFLRWYVSKGAVPYGDHQPFPAHEDNGKCSAAAVLFDLLGDREAAEFFTQDGHRRLQRARARAHGELFQHPLGDAGRRARRSAGHRRVSARAVVVLRSRPRVGYELALPRLARRRGGTRQLQRLGHERQPSARLRAAAEKPAPHGEKAVYRDATQCRASRGGHRRGTRLRLQG